MTFKLILEGVNFPDTYKYQAVYVSWAQLPVSYYMISAAK